MTGRLTLPTDADVIDETLRLKNLLGADALRDCDGTEMPENFCQSRLRNTLLIIQQERTMSGRKQIRMRFSSAIL